MKGEGCARGGTLALTGDPFDQLSQAIPEEPGLRISLLLFPTRLLIGESAHAGLISFWSILVMVR